MEGDQVDIDTGAEEIWCGALPDFDSDLAEAT